MGTPAADLATRRVRMTVAYDGSDHHGFAAQPGVDTIGGTLAATIGRILRLPEVELTCAGRTDAGVHAWGQVVSFDVPVDHLDRAGPPDTLRDLVEAVNKLCGPTIVARDAAIVDDRFDARFSARTRRYRYTIVNRAVPDPFLARTAWHVATPLDVRCMILACDALIGEHDFSSFCRRPKVGAGAEPVSLVRRVRRARWDERDDGVLHFWIEADAFCHQMVRSIVGTLVEVGRGKRKAGEMMGIIAAQDRHAAGDLAPPRGLCLWSVEYDPDPPPDPHVDDGSRVAITERSAAIG